MFIKAASSLRLLHSISDAAMWQSSPTAQGTQVHTESSQPSIGEQTTTVSDQHPILVHFSCHGRRKTTHLKTQFKLKMREGAPSIQPRGTKPLRQKQKSVGMYLDLTTSQQAATQLDVPDSPQKFPSMLMMSVDQNLKPKRLKRSPMKMLQVPKILVLDSEEEREDVDRELPSQRIRCQQHL